MKENPLLLAEYNKDFNEKEPKFKFGDHVKISKYQKTYLPKDTHKTGQKNFLLLAKLKTQFRGHTRLVT